MRCLHGPCRRRADAVLLVAGIGGGRDQGHDPRRAWHSGQAAPAAGGLHRRAGSAMRLLPQWLDHDRSSVAARHPTPVRATDPRRPLGPQMPLRDPYGDPARGTTRGAGDVKEATMNEFSIDRRSLFKGAGALVISIGIPCDFAEAEIGSA